MIRAHTVLLLSVAAGCTETIQLSNDSLDNLVALEITPADHVLLIDLGPQRQTLQYTATGRFSDGSSRDVTSLVRWSIDDPNKFLGGVAAGLFTASHEAGGYATIRADGRDQSATAKLKVRIEDVIIDPVFPPPGADLFNPMNPVIGGEPTRSPKLIYPSDGTVFPQGLPRTLFQYTRGATNDAVQLTFDSDVLHLVVQSGADRWSSDGIYQRVLAGSGRAGPIRAEIRATYSLGTGVVYKGNVLALTFSRDAPLAPLYYWSAASNGIMRGGIDTVSASPLLPGSTACVGCHTISRTGTTMAMGYDDTISFDLQTIDLATLATRIPASVMRPMGWATFSPDGLQILVANNGGLTLYDATNGNSLGTVPLPPMRYATHPDWSPDGAFVAIALTSQTPNNLDVKASSIARIPYNNGAWGMPETLVPGATTNNNYFPKYSPDGKQLLYVHAAGTSQGAPTAELMVMPSGGGSSTRLRVASHRVASVDDVPDLANTMPTWSTQLGERAWIAFVSARPYGLVPTGGRGQIWITSIDLTAAGDPSSAAFWLPCQDVTVLNNNPVWSSDIIGL